MHGTNGTDAGPFPLTLGRTVKIAAAEADAMLAEALVRAGERAMRPRTGKHRAPGRTATLRDCAGFWAYATRWTAREKWRALPGPWPVKAATVAGLAGVAAVCLMIPGPLDEAAVVAAPKAYRLVRSALAGKAARA